MLKIAILGSGRVAKARVREINLRTDTKVVVLASQSPQHAQEIAGDIEVSTNWLEVVERTDIDIVMICTHNYQHAAMCQRALQAGKHVSVDYPLALSAQEVSELITLAKQVNRVLHVEHIELLSPWFQVIQNNMARIGRLIALDWRDISSEPTTGSNWTRDLRAGFSMFVHEAILSRLVALAGKPDWVNAHEYLQMVDKYNYQQRLTMAQIGFTNGVIAQLCDGVGWPASLGNNQLTLIGTEGSIVAQNRQQVAIQHKGGVEQLPLPSTKGLFAQDIEYFLTQISTGCSSYASLDHIWAVAQLAEAIQSACKKQARIVIE